MAKKIDYASMFTLRSDGRYQGYWHDLVDGAPKGKRHTICDRDPEKLYRRIQEKETAAETVLTFGVIAEAWHDKHWEEIREGTKACYDAPYKRALEQFGDRAADEIQVSDIRAHLEQMKAGGYSAKTIKTQRTIYKLIFQYITTLVRKYRQGGIEAIAGNHYGGNRRNMSVEKEAEILAPFKERAEKGEIVEVSEIEAAYQAEVDHPIGNSQIYFVLRRHNWRKVMPRSKHPKKASEEVIATSKKLKEKSRN